MPQNLISSGTRDHLGMAVRLGVRDALIQQLSIQLVVALHPQQRGNEAFPHQTELVLDENMQNPGGMVRRGVGAWIGCLAAGLGGVEGCP
jgi:hypothetical protein